MTGCFTQNEPHLLIGFCDGTLPPAEAAAVELHVAACSACAGLVREQAAVWSALDSWAPPAISPSFQRDLYARIDAEAQRPWWIRWFNWRPLAPLTAAATMAALALLLQSPQQNTMPQSGAELDAEQVERALEDIEMLSEITTPASVKSL